MSSRPVPTRNVDWMLLRIIADSIQSTGLQPTFRQIAVQIGHLSPGWVHVRMEAMHKAGIIVRRGVKGIEFDWSYYTTASLRKHHKEKLNVNARLRRRRVVRTTLVQH